MINMLQAPVERLEDIHEQMGHFSREMETISKWQRACWKEMYPPHSNRDKA